MPTTPNDSDRRDVPVAEAVGVSVVRDGTTLLGGVDLAVGHDEHWVVMGRNGCGKSTLLRILSLWMHPSHGTVRVQGRALGEFDIRPVRPRLPLVSDALASMLRPAMTVHEAVISAAHGALETWWHDYGDAEASRAGECLSRFGIGHLARRPLSTLSTGEHQRVMLARALMTGPLAMFLDEPMAGLDLAGREEMHGTLTGFAGSDDAVPTVLVTHHVEEIPPSTTHCLVLRAGRTVASGPVEDALSAGSLSDAFGIAVRLDRRVDGRWTATAG